MEAIWLIEWNNACGDCWQNEHWNLQNDGIYLTKLEAEEAMAPLNCDHATVRFRVRAYGAIEDMNKEREKFIDEINERIKEISELNRELKAILERY